MGMTTMDVIDTLDIALDGRTISLYRDTVDKERENIFITFKQDLETDLDKILDLNVNYQPSPKVDVNGNIYKIKMEKSVKLKELITVEEKMRDNQIFSENRSMTYSVTGEMGDRSVTYASIDILTKMYDYKLPFTDKTKLVDFNLYSSTYEDENTGFRYVVEWDGEWELTLDVFRDLGLAMMVAIFLIYVILVAQFKSFRIPAVILGTIPLGLIGVLPGYAILNTTDGLYFNATSMIGVIALAGIVVNNAIIMIEYQKQLQEEGRSLRDAVITASATRLRPIVLTSLTTILGSLTLIGDPVWAGLGWSIILGMLASTILTLTVFPVFLYTMIKTKNK
jgi:multidrug efflux pump subunit AcrB